SQRPLAVDVQERMHRGVQRLDAVEAGADEVAGGDLPPSKACQQVGGRGVYQDGYSVSMTGGTLKNPFSGSAALSSTASRGSGVARTSSRETCVRASR